MLTDDPKLPVTITKQRRSRDGRWKKAWKGIVRFGKSKWPGLYAAFVLGCTLTFVSMQIYFVPSEKLSLHDENVELKKANNELSTAIADRDEKIQQLTVPTPQALSWHEIEDGFAKRSGRNAEQNNFIREYVAKEIEWEISLQFQYSVGGWSFLYFENGSLFRPAALFGAQFVKDSPVSSLKPGDRIKARGKLATFGEDQLKITEATYDFIAPAPTSN
jgi:hypothetical protein